MPFDNFFFKENILFGQNQKKKKKTCGLKGLCTNFEV